MPKTQPIAPVQGPAVTDPLIGQRLGEFVIERFIAQGGMGMVYAAMQPVLNRRAAVKVLRPELVADAEQKDRFFKEARAISSINHRGIIQVYSFGWLPDGRQYMVMEFLEGKTLEQLLHEEGPMLSNRALPIVDEILDALSAAHEVGVVHRDLKPSNVFMAMQSNGSSYAKLVDFGLAKDLAGQATAKASVIAGTPEYISPEQARGVEVTPRTDLYCLGVMVFEMISGGLPFAGSNLIGFLRAHLEQPAPRLSSYVPVPESLDELVASLLEKDPAARPRSAEAVRREIAQILRETREDSTQQVARPRERVSKPVSRGVPDDDFSFGETKVSGSDPAAAALIKEAREKASGPRAAPKPSRPSQSRLKRPSQSGLKRPSQPNLPRPSPSGLPRPSQAGPRRPSRELPVREGNRITGETDQSLAPIADEPAKTLEPFAPVVPTPAPPVAPASAGAPRVPTAALAAGFVFLAAVGGVLSWAVVSRSGHAQQPRIVEMPVPPPPPEKTVGKPVESATTPAPDPAIEAQLKAEAERQKEESRKHGERGFLQNLGSGALGHGELLNSPERVDGYKRAFGGEIAETSRQQRLQAGLRPELEQARKEVRDLKAEKEAEEKYQDVCKRGWGRQAKARTAKLRKDKLAALDPDAASFADDKERVEGDARDLVLLIDSLDDARNCRLVQEQLQSWEHARVR